MATPVDAGELLPAPAVAEAVDGDAPAVLEQRLRAALAQRGQAKVRLERGEDGLIAVITADERVLDKHELVDRAVRLAAELGLNLKGLVLNGARLDHPELRYPEAPWPSRP